MPIAKNKVSGLYLRGYLAGLRKITGKQYLNVLQQCGLERFADKYPPGTVEPVAESSQVARINESIYNLVGPGLYNLFQQNIGREFARSTSSFPLLQQTMAQIGTIKTKAELEHILHIVAQLGCESIDQVITLKPTDSPNSLVVVYEKCIHCVKITQNEQPPCLLVSAFFKEIVYTLGGLRSQVTETHCAALHGGVDCEFLMTFSLPR